MLSGKKILVGLTGSIAAYKTSILIRELIKLEAEVQVIMTSASSDFITPLTLSTLSKNPVHIDFVKNEQGEWTNHVELALWADLMIIAPASANSISKMSVGICDNLLMATFLSAKCPVWVAPAMDLDMFLHPTTKHNLEILSERGNVIIEPTYGELASGLEGKGRMEEPQIIAEKINSFFNPANSSLFGKNIMITAGPTYEKIDPVRFIGNHSTGKTGVLLAEKLAGKGAKITLILGPSSLLPKKQSNIQVIHVTSADEMFSEVKKYWEKSDIGIFSAAVADYKPNQSSNEKIKKTGENLTLELVKNPDLLKWAGEKKKDNQYLVGFALETNNEIEHAKEKLTNKNLDALVLNSLRDKGAGFGLETNKITILKRNNKMINFELKNKSNVVDDIIFVIEEDIKP